jgi:adenosyl cobinamide kinase/adenosyl cobinamide phosphate guanylyltransferase
MRVWQCLHKIIKVAVSFVTKEAWKSSNQTHQDHESNHWNESEILDFCSFLNEFKLMFWIVLLNNITTMITHSNTNQILSRSVLRFPPNIVHNMTQNVLICIKFTRMTRLLKDDRVPDFQHGLELFNDKDCVHTLLVLHW